MIIIYLETNSIMAIAKGRNKELEDFVYHSSDNLKFVIPSICLMETLIALLTYYHDHREEIRQQIEDGEAFAKQLQGNKPSLVEKILKGENVKQD